MQITWRKLNERMATLSEDEIMAMLEYERTHDKRVKMLLRLHQRGNALRVARERIELLKEGVRP
jgi:predicted secreted protein